MNERSERMEFLLRVNAGRRRLPSFLAALSSRIGRPVSTTDVFPLERGDALWKVVSGELRTSRTEAPPAFSRWAPDALDALDVGLRSLAGAIDERAVLYLPASPLCIGPVLLAPEEIGAHVRAISEEATEECTITSEDGRCGLRLDYQAVEHEHGAPFPYELSLWGTAWRAVARDTLPFVLASPAA